MSKEFFLGAAYFVAWAVHILYLLSLSSRFSRLRKEIDELLQDKPRR